MADPLVLINTFEVSHEDAERFIAPGEEAELPCRSAWYVDTALHQAVSPVQTSRSSTSAAGRPPGTSRPPRKALASGSQLRAWPGTARIWTLLAGRP